MHMGERRVIAIIAICGVYLYHIFILTFVYKAASEASTVEPAYIDR